MGIYDGYDDLRGRKFHHTDLRESQFRDVYLNDARFRDVVLTGVDIADAVLQDVTISAYVENVTINGVDVAPLIEAELDRRHPDRPKMRPTDAAGYLEAWDILERLWDETVERARRLPPEKLHERVNGEWSFIQTLRHLVMATDSWILRAYLGDPTPYHPLGLPFDGLPVDTPNVPRDYDAYPSLDEILEVRADRKRRVREVFTELTEAKLHSMTEPVLEPGYPASESFPVERCLSCILSEEWEHRLYAERDLALLESGVGSESGDGSDDL
jgi:hypothetical protein